jgi:hypothetical protein
MKYGTTKALAAGLLFALTLGIIGCAVDHDSDRGTYRYDSRYDYGSYDRGFDRDDWRYRRDQDRDQDSARNRDWDRDRDRDRTARRDRDHDRDYDHD